MTSTGEASLEMWVWRLVGRAEPQRSNSCRGGVEREDEEDAGKQ